MPLPDNQTRAIVFDAYGTLFDVHSAVMRHAGALGPQAAAFSAHWRAKQLEYTWTLSLMGEYEPFAELTAQALDHAFASFAGTDRGLRDALLDAYLTLSPYPEVAETLAALRHEGHTLAILSNGDRQMLRAVIEAAGLRSTFAAVLSVEEVQVFKTDPRAYGLVEKHLGTAPDEVTFVSSNRWDVAAGAQYGFRTVWVNRLGLPDEYGRLAPDLVVGSLAGLL